MEDKGGVHHIADKRVIGQHEVGEADHIPIGIVLSIEQLPCSHAPYLSIVL